MTKIVDGKKLASEIENNLKQKVKEHKKSLNLKVFLLNKNPESALYVKMKQKKAEELEIALEIERDYDSDTGKVLEKIDKANRNKRIDGILIQLPLRKDLDERQILDAIDPRKDVDCLTSQNLGLLFAGTPLVLPATVSGILKIVESLDVDLKGKRAAIVGTSNIVGKPLGAYMHNLGATVTLVDENEKNLEKVTKNADILVTATGVKGLITKEMIKEEAIVIDAGISKEEGSKKVYGDVLFDEVSSKASAITPVPGGVGPLTIACLLENLVILANNQK